MNHRLALCVAIVLVALRAGAQVSPHLEEFDIPGGVTCQIPAEWMVDVRQVDAIPDAEAYQPRVLFSAHPMMRIGPSRNGEQESFTVSRWPAPAEPKAPFDASRNPLDMNETFSLRQALALDGFTIAKAWTTGTDSANTQVVSSTYAGHFARGYPWLVETTTWRTGNMIYAAQLRYPEQVFDRYLHFVSDIKSNVAFNALPVPAFASGYVTSTPALGTEPQHPSLVASRPVSRSVASPSTPVPVASPAAAVTGSDTLLQEAKEAGKVAQQVGKSVALVEGKEKAGSAFVCKLAGQEYVVTNTHVVAGNTGINIRMSNRAPLQLGKAAAAVGYDLTRVAVVPGAVPALEVMDNIAANLAVGDAVLVFGNSEGAHVVNNVRGKVVGIGPDLIEVDAPFVPGYSGGPIIQLRSGKLIGVATYALVRELQSPADSLDEPKVRRFGYRLDGVQAWQGIEWNSFNVQAEGIRQVQALTLDLARLWRTMAGTTGPLVPAQNAALRKAEIEYSQATTASKSSNADLSNARQSFLFVVRSLCTSDLAGLRPTLTYDYFQRQAAEEQKIRDELAKVFNQIFNSQSNNADWRYRILIR